jgi:hypothetical protein
MDQNEQLKKTHLPNQVAVVRIADAAPPGGGTRCAAEQKLESHREKT